MAVRFFLICSRIPKSDVRKAKKDSSNANKKDVRTITQSEEQEKLLSDLLGGIRDRKFYVELAFPYVACTTFAQENVLSELLLKWI